MRGETSHFGRINFVVAAASVLMACSCQEREAPNSRDEINRLARAIQASGNSEAPELRGLKRRALLGEIEASAVLEEIYNGCVLLQNEPEGAAHPLLKPECLNQGRFWARLTAENGSLVSAANLAQNLMSSGRCEDVYRARFWLSKSKEWGNKTFSKGDLVRLSQMERRCGW